MSDRASWRRARKAGGRKHAWTVHRCYLCGRECRGNGGITSHERACYRKHGAEWLDAERRTWLAVNRAGDYAAYRAIEAAIRRRLQPESSAHTEGG